MGSRGDADWELLALSKSDIEKRRSHAELGG